MSKCNAFFQSIHTEETKETQKYLRGGNQLFFDLKITRIVDFIEEDQDGGAETRLLTQCNPCSQEQLCKGLCWQNHPLYFVSVTERHFNLGGNGFHSDLLSPFKALKSPQKKKRAQKVSLK